MARRNKGEGSVFLRNRVWWICYVKDAKKVWESSGSIHKQDALALLKERQAHPADKSYTVNDLLDILVQDLEDRGKRDLRRTKSHLQHVRDALGSVRVVDLNEDMVEKYQRTRSKSGASNSTVNRECQPLGQALNKLAYRKKIISRPVYVRKLPEQNVRTDFFEPFEAEKVIYYLPEYLKDYVRFAYISGWRKNECATLTWTDVSIPSQLIRLNPMNSKTGDMRILPIIGELVDLIARRKAERIADCPYIFHRHGQFIRSFRKAWVKATECAGCPNRVFHALRRSSARDKLRAGTHESIVMRAQGWKTRSIFDRYNITSERDIEQALIRTEEYRKNSVNYMSTMAG